MPFHAAKPVPCIRCHGTIAQGEPISWTRGKGAQPGVYHFACPGETPGALTFAPGYTPEAAAYETATAEPAPPDYIDDELPPEPEPEPIPQPGTRAWFSTATMRDREHELAVGVQGGALSPRQFAKLVARYSTRLTDKETARLRRYARGLWDGAMVHTAPMEPPSRDQLELWPLGWLAPAADTHGEHTQAWRGLLTVWTEAPV